MRIPKIFTAIVAAALVVFSASASAEPKAIDFVEGVDWQNSVITVTGEGLAPLDAVNLTQAKALAVKAAQADAYRKLGEIINGVHVEGETTIEKMRTTQDRIKLRVEATIKGAKTLSENFLADGTCRVIMQVPLFGASNSLADAVLEKNSQVEPFPEPVYEVAPSIQQYNSSTPVKRRIEITSVTIEEESYVPAPATPYKPPLSRMSLQTLDTIILQKVQENSFAVCGDMTTRKPIQKSVAEYASTAQGGYTGLVVDCRGLELQPVMSPVILNSNGTKIYGHKNLDIDRVIREGMADYSEDTARVGRAGSNPLVVKALAVQNFNSNPVLSIPDSNRVLIENYASKFLSDLKVVFLF